MRYAWIAVLSVLMMPALAQAGSKYSFFFGFGGFGGCSPWWGGGWGGGWCGPRYFAPYCGPSYSIGFGYSNFGSGPRYYGGGSYGRSAVAPRVFSPYRYGGYGSGYARDYGYRRGYDNRYVSTRGRDYGYGGVPIARSDRSVPYYGPALERYSRDARENPSYHFNRREASTSHGRSGAFSARASRDR